MQAYPGLPAPPAAQPASAPRKYDGKNGMPNYDTAHGGHYGASSTIAAGGSAPPPETFTGQWANVSQGLNGQYRDILNTYWQNQVTKLETEEHDYKIHQLPLARIKKVMKADPEVKMISAEAPILFAKGCDIFITELTMRAWIHAEENKRRTLQRSDIASALAKSDMFDFLIDIVPREDATPQHKRRPEYTPVGTYQVPGAGGDPSNAGAPAGPGAGMQEHGQPSMGGQEFAGIEQAHMQGQPTYQQQTGMYPPPAPQQAQYAGQPMFDPSMYAPPQSGYGMGGMQPMQQMYATGPPPQQPQPPQQQPQSMQSYRPSDPHAPEDDAQADEDYGGAG
ncbi:Transcriptional activator hap5 [Recurvomyces mirabilis]|uniref:Transcriptional activator hap5 n=1 Tax=Recurvomyces mirabilis TaxID=574656 RepID=A0AAE0WKV5_9PEZI|nr:Transcriptional activator hap5 [Recurvomyces mirabilis]KAK5151086.1 CCAAT- binding transcription factor component [Recurvomyces mirabilis]